MICIKYPLIIEEKFLAECPSFGENEFSTESEAIEVFFDLVEVDTIEKSEWKLLYYLTNRGIISLRSEEVILDDFSKLYEILCDIYNDTKKKAAAKRYKESLFLPNNEVLNNKKITFYNY